MTAPAPHPGADNPFTGAYQTRQFPYTKAGDPDVTVFDSLSTPPASGVAARAATRYGASGASGGTGASGSSGASGGTGASGSSGASGDGGTGASGSSGASGDGGTGASGS